MIINLTFSLILCSSLASGFRSVNMPRTHASHNILRLNEGSSGEKMLDIPQSILLMMQEAAQSVISAKDDGKPLVRIEIPLPVTGGTELDDWPGGIRQKYNTLRPLLCEMLKELNFSSTAINQQEFIPNGEDDVVGLWRDQGFQIICFPTLDSIEYINSCLKWADNSSTIVLVNQQFFLDPLSRQVDKDFLETVETVYKLETVYSKGPSALPVRGIIMRKYPRPFQIGRRLDQGGYVELKTYEKEPLRPVIDKLFFEDSEIRDKNLSLLDRLKKQVPNFGN